MNKILNITVPEDTLPTRLDKYLSSQIDLTRSRIQGLIESSNVTVNGKIITSTSHKVKAGYEITLTIPPPEESQMQVAEIELSVVFEDEHLLVIDKPAGLTVHPGAGNHQDTLANALLHHCGDSLSGIGGVQRPGIVHRLDKDTSGLLVAAKHDEAHLKLSAQLKDRSLKRIYQAVCWGIPQPASGVIDTHINRHPKDRVKMAVAEDGKQAITRYKVSQVFMAGKASLVQCQLETGRTHQIRVHMQHINCHIIGDQTYGKKLNGHFVQALPEDLQKLLSTFKRQALHAKEISFIHPASGEEMSFECDDNSETWKDIKELIGVLRS